MHYSLSIHQVKEMMKKSIVIIILSVLAAAFLSGCLQSSDSSGRMNIVDNITELKISQFESTQKLKKFNSVEEIREFLLKANAQPNAFYYGQYDIRGDIDITEGVSVPPVPGVTPGVTPALAPETSASEYSKTNIQVEGVDEADFVKNDNKHIYVLAQKKLVIVDAFPAANASILSSVMIEGRPVDMFVNEERLVVFTEDSDEVPVYPEYEYRPVMNYAPRTTALVFDIADRKKPVQIANYSINGNYFRSRMIGEFVYFMVKDDAYYSYPVNMPVIKQDETKLITPDVYYFDNPEQNYVFHTIASLNLNSGKIDAKSFMMGYSDNLYVSENNIYITYYKNFPVRYYETEREERFYNVVVPQLPEEVQREIYDIKDSRLSSYEKWDKISSILEETYNRMDVKERLIYLRNVYDKINEYDGKLSEEREKIVIQKIKIDKGEIEYKAKGEVPGILLNQFSMDEGGEYFRVATTTHLWTRSGYVEHNNVYVLNKDLSIVGKLEGIAKDERIYSTRFIGDRLYMVTFKRMDPLFVIDLSEPENPRILGELKIPGFSDYLHPYDDNHIIGVGKETRDEGWGGVSIKGVKLSIFDVSDVNNPKQLDKYEIGSAGTDSEALRDHKAFLFDKKKNLLLIPIREAKGMERGYMQRVWQGAYVLGVTPEEGFKLRGKVSHLDDYEEEMYYWNSPNAVRRSLYLDDVLYTISARKVFMNDLDNMGVVNSITLPFDKDQYYEYGWK